MKVLVTATVPLTFDLPEEMPENVTREELVLVYLHKIGLEGAVVHSIEEVPVRKH